MQTPLLNALLAEMRQAIPSLEHGPERPFGKELFTMPVRAFAGSFTGHEQAIASLAIFDIGPAEPEYLAEAPTQKVNLNTYDVATQGANLTQQVATLLLQLDALEDKLPSAITWKLPLSGDFWQSHAAILVGQALIVERYQAQGQEDFLLSKIAVGLPIGNSGLSGYDALLPLTTQAMVAHIGRTDALYLPAFAAPSDGPNEATLRERIHQIVSLELRLEGKPSLTKGAYWPTLLQLRLREAALQLHHRLKREAIPGRALAQLINPA